MNLHRDLLLKTERYEILCKNANIIYQELWGAEYIQSEGLDPGVVDSQLPVDPWTFNTGEDTQVGGQPRGVWGEKKKRARC